MLENTVNVIEGSTFLISDSHGDACAEIDSRKTDGLFYRDMRHLSTFALAVKGPSLAFLSTDASYMDLRLYCPAGMHEPARGIVKLDLPAKSEWTLALDIFPYEGDEELAEFHCQHGLMQTRNLLQEDLKLWIEESPQLFSSSDPLSHSWRKSIEDLAALRSTDEGEKDEEIIAAGLPWFMALFGRDSLICA